jgi:lambda family phage minor tail protein L
MAEEGKNKVARSLLDLQPTAILEIFRIYPDRVNQPNLFMGFHGGAIYSQSIVWQDYKYLPLSMESEGFDILGDGKLARPKIRVANQHNIITQFLQVYKDFKNAKVVRKRVSVKFIDDVNFEGGNPFGEADPNAELTNETWLMGRKTQESKLFVEFELTSPLDIDNFSVNSRNIISKFCYWQYRGEGCRYAGLPIEDSDGNPFEDIDGVAVVPKYNAPADSPVWFFNDESAIWNPSKEYEKGDIVVTESPTLFLANEKANGVGTPLKTVFVCVSGGHNGQPPEGNPSYWRKDGCSKRLSACQKRFTTAQSVAFRQGQNITRNFDCIQISGQSNTGTHPDPMHTGLFHTTVPELTGQLTGEFTIMGWVNINSNSPIGAGILSTSPRDDLNWPNNQFLNINSDTRIDPEFRRGTDQFVEEMISKTRQQRTDNVSVNYMGYLIDPSDASEEKNAFRSIFLHGEQKNNMDSRKWFQYIITNSTGSADFINGEGEEENTVIKFYVNGESKSDDLNSEILSQNLGNFASLSQRKNMTWPPDGEKALPQTFMLGAVEYYGGTSGYDATQTTAYTTSMNGALGPWAVWNRAINDEERDYLRKPISPPFNVTNSIDFAPRNYDECTGRFGTLTGSGDGTLSYGSHSLVAWWDGTTGHIGGTTTNAMLDIHTGDIHLTGSGDFTGISQSYEEAPLALYKNATTPNPNFGGFPGTDGFSYGRNSQM